MDELLKMLEGLIQSSRVNGQKPTAKQNWKYCVVLLAKGWNVRECKKITGTGDITIRWTKEGEKEIILRLSLYDQGKWIEYLEQRRKR